MLKSFVHEHLEYSAAESYHILHSLIFLIATACICASYVAWHLIRPGRYSVWERLLYAPVYTLARVLWRVEIEWSDGGWKRSQLLADRIRTGALLIANHRCSLDPFFIQLVSGKRVHWMVAGEYFKHPLFGPLLRSYQAIPTNRGGVDTASTKRAIALAKRGGFVGMFPEGRINRSDKPLLSIRPGAAIVAARAGVPLVPIWIEGAPRGWEVYSALFMAAHVKIIVGRPNRFKIQPGSNDSPLVSEEGLNMNPTTEANLTKEEAIQWITDAMQQSLELGGNAAEGVDIAGRNWLNG